MSNHTTGTWKNQTMGGCENGRQILSGKLHLATCHYGYGIDVNEANANAALIAAAPELLSLLLEVYDTFTDDNYNPPNHKLRVWLDQTKAVILKATTC
jgi:hypothetical protein